MNLLEIYPTRSKGRWVGVMILLCSLVLGARLDLCSAVDQVVGAIGTLKDGSPEVRAGAAEFLGKSRDDRAVVPLVAALNDEDPRVRESVASALGSTRDPRGVKPLISALKDADPGVRSKAAFALGRIQDLRAVGPLTAALKDADREVRSSAIHGLTYIEDPRVVTSLTDALNDGDAMIRESAAVQVGNALIEARRRHWSDIRPLLAAEEGAVRPLIAALEDKEWIVRRQVVRALTIVGWPAVEPLVAALKGADANVRKGAAQVLGNIHDDRSTAVLMTFWNRKDLVVISGAYSFFIRRGEPGSEGTLIEALLADGDSSMAEAFINCGNAQLRSAGVKWGAARGAQVVPDRFGSGGARWSSGR